MRTITTSQQEALDSRHRREPIRVLISDANDTLQDMTEFVRSVHVETSVEQQTVNASVTLHREIPGRSLAPLMQIDPEIDISRRLVIEAAVLEATDLVEESDWITLFDSEIDDADWGGTESILSIPARGPWGRFHDEWVEWEETYGSDASPVLVEDLMQELMDEVLGEGEVELLTIGDPDIGVSEYEQRVSRLSEALNALRDLNGWDLRFRWHEPSDAFRLVFQEPERDKEVPDYTFDADDYFEVSRIAKSMEGVRRVVILKWRDTGTQEDFVIVEDETLEEGDRRKPIFLDASRDKQIATLAQALALATAVFDDVNQPPVLQSVEGRFFPFVEIGDLLRYEGNTVHYLEAQEMACTGWRHEFHVDEGWRTAISVRGRPSGGSSRWHTRSIRDRDRQDILPPEEDPDPPDPPGDADWYYTVSESEASQGFEEPSERDESLGGYTSTTRVANVGLNDIFRSFSTEEQNDGHTLYRVLALANTHEELIWESVRVYLSGYEDLHEDAVLEIGLDPVGVVTLESESVQGYELTDEETAPSGVSFSSPDELQDGLEVGDLGTNETIHVHVRLSISANFEDYLTGEVLLCAATCPPSSGSSS